MLTCLWFFMFQTFLFLKSGTASSISTQSAGKTLTLSEKKKFYSHSLFLKATLLNIFFFILLFQNITDFYFYSNNIYWCYLNKSVALKIMVSAFTFFFFYLNFKQLLNNSKIWNLISLNIVFILFFFFFFYFNMLNVVFMLEFCNIAILLYLISSVSLERVGLQNFKKNKLFNNKINWPFYFISAVTNNFFFLFIFTVFFFFSFFYYFEHHLFFSSIQFVLNLRYFNELSWISIIFLVVFFLKVGAAPFFVWKIEVFNTLSYFYIFFYNVGYFVFFTLFFYTFFNYLNLFDNCYYILCLIVALNTIFLSANVFNTVTLKMFLILSTLINFNFVLFSVLVSGASYSTWFIFFLVILNYVLSSFVLFFFLIFFFKSDVLFLTDLRNYSSKGYGTLLFIAPLISFSGVAPTLGFLAKFLLLVNSNNSYSFWLSILLYVFIAISTVFYFNVFKTFFSVAPASLKKKNDYYFKGSSHSPFFFFFIVLSCLILLLPISFFGYLVAWYGFDTLVMV